MQFWDLGPDPNEFTLAMRVQIKVKVIDDVHFLVVSAEF